MEAKIREWLEGIIILESLKHWDIESLVGGLLAEPWGLLEMVEVGVEFWIFPLVVVLTGPETVLLGRWWGWGVVVVSSFLIVR